jgi:hypothetical protein
MRRLAAIAVAVALAAGAADARATERYGDLTFPADEHAQPSSWDYWWGAGELRTKSGNRYVLELAFTSIDGAMSASYIIYPLQGPYRGQGIMSMEGPTEWGHPNPSGRALLTMTMNLPGLPDRRLQLDTYDTQRDMKLISRWERTTLDKPKYRLMLDQDDAKLHPDGGTVDLELDLTATMRKPLLAGGTGRWFYGVPEDFDYPSRAYQYQQVPRRLVGGFHMTMPDGEVIKEQLRPKASLLTMTRESNPKEAIPVGIGLALSHQVHPRYFQSYNLQWPWELIYADLGNGAQLQFDLQSYHDTPKGLVKINEAQPTYRVLSTLRLRNGTSVVLNDKLHAEELSMRTLGGIAAADGNMLASPWVQGWRLRVQYPGGVEKTADGRKVRVPAFDLGLKPHFKKSEPLADEGNNRLTQRVPFMVSGSYGGCPVDGFAWSELLSNWYGWEDVNPWLNRGGKLPRTPKRCGAKVKQIPLHQTGELNPPPEPPAPPTVGYQMCQADEAHPTCEFTAEHDGGIAANGLPGGWKVTITRPGRTAPIVLTSYGSSQVYPCGTIRAGDHVLFEAQPGSSVAGGNPGICI